MGEGEEEDGIGDGVVGSADRGPGIPRGTPSGLPRDAELDHDRRVANGDELGFASSHAGSVNGDNLHNGNGVCLGGMNVARRVVLVLVVSYPYVSSPSVSRCLFAHAYLGYA
jgi:hypothetical protein